MFPLFTCQLDAQVDRRRLVSLEVTHVKRAVKLMHSRKQEARYLFKIKYDEPSNPYSIQRELIVKKVPSDLYKLLQSIDRLPCLLREYLMSDFAKVNPDMQDLSQFHADHPGMRLDNHHVDDKQDEQLQHIFQLLTKEKQQE